MRLTLCCMLLIAPLQAGCSKATSHDPAEEAPPNEAWITPQQLRDARIQLRPVAEEDVGGVVTASGKITFDDLRVSHVYSPVTGRVVRILAQLGDRVTKGSPLAVIESPDVGVAFSDLNKAEADLAASRREFARQTELFEAHAASQKDYEADRK